jgi:predicted short-subunit dehydrogenase-like oxidoreductase (DUF2520 family)
MDLSLVLAMEEPTAHQEVLVEVVVLEPLIVDQPAQLVTTVRQDLPNNLELLQATTVAVDKLYQQPVQKAHTTSFGSKHPLLPVKRAQVATTVQKPLVLQLGVQQELSVLQAPLQLY